jgi:hypothetical protein
VRYLGAEVDDAIEIAEKIDIHEQAWSATVQGRPTLAAG